MALSVPYTLVLAVLPFLLPSVPSLTHPPSLAIAPSPSQALVEFCYQRSGHAQNTRARLSGNALRRVVIANTDPVFVRALQAAILRHCAAHDVAEKSQTGRARGAPAVWCALYLAARRMPGCAVATRPCEATAKPTNAVFKHHCTSIASPRSPRRVSHPGALRSPAHLAHVSLL